MATRLTDYFRSELAEWSRTMLSYLEELDRFKIKLNGLIQRNTIPNIAEKVEREQHKLNQVSRKIHLLLRKIQKQEAELRVNSIPADDASIGADTRQLQSELRRIIQDVEKEYIEKKHACNNYLSGIIKE